MRSALSLGYFDSRKRRTINRFPAGILLATGGLLTFATVAVLFGQETGIGVVREEASRPLAVRDITITRAAGDQVVVTDATTGAVIVAYPANEGGFVRGSLRAFERMRDVASAPKDAAYRLIRWESGRVSLSDTATGERVYLDAFGRDNAAAFAALLGPQGGGQP
ncbi:phosphonoacetaldehyde hydrolase [Niveispirillum lacus]|uniref:Phosphonoacetaldehyde hydrolase n=1 Tax=Niveispirillum lacus TaxID=1981099 RepID=A0A255Z1P9_9PROT|nr:photosynthetic complex assembly protein PuhC [Niveispirillum lacus]OYQ34580.1 phosphonoacetaldehyde hydrolase [Niveispirillum lacus]